MSSQAILIQIGFFTQGTLELSFFIDHNICFSLANFCGQMVIESVSIFQSVSTYITLELTIFHWEVSMCFSKFIMYKLWILPLCFTRLDFLSKTFSQISQVYIRGFSWCFCMCICKLTSCVYSLWQIGQIYCSFLFETLKLWLISADFLDGRPCFLWMFCKWRASVCLE